MDMACIYFDHQGNGFRDYAKKKERKAIQVMFSGDYETAVIK
jgi:hypothetical protein